MSQTDDRELRNSIFAAKQAAEAAGMQAVSREESARKELGIEIPTALVPLPSRGMIYPKESPLHGQDQVEIKGMTANEENILMSRALIKKGTVITELIKACMMDPRIDVNSMVSGDRNALMVAIRITGYGTEYSPTVQCPQCETRNEIDINLADLEIKHLEIEPLEVGKNEFAFTTPITKKKVTFRFLTGKEEEEIIATAESRKKKGLQNDNVITTRLQYSLLSVDGVYDRGMVNKFSMHMPAKDSLVLRTYIDKNEPGIDMRFNFKCKNSDCSCEEVMAVPMGPTFFGLTPEDKEQVYLEPFFLLGYYFGMTWSDYKTFPVSYKIWLIKRINDEIKKSAEQQNDIPAKGAHNHTPDMRALTQKSRTNVPAKLQRFT